MQVESIDGAFLLLSVPQDEDQHPQSSDAHAGAPIVALHPIFGLDIEKHCCLPLGPLERIQFPEHIRVFLGR